MKRKLAELPLGKAHLPPCWPWAWMHTYWMEVCHVCFPVNKLCLDACFCEHGFFGEVTLHTNVHLSRGSRRKTFREKVNDGVWNHNRYLSDAAGVCWWKVRGSEMWNRSYEKYIFHEGPARRYNQVRKENDQDVRTQKVECAWPGEKSTAKVREE